MTISADKALFEKAEILISIPSVAKATAFAMLIEMQELREKGGKNAVRLAGVAPISRQTGKWQGKERI